MSNLSYFELKIQEYYEFRMKINNRIKTSMNINIVAIIEYYETLDTFFLESGKISRELDHSRVHFYKMACLIEMLIVKFMH